MDSAFFIAKRQEDGAPGFPIGNDDGAISIFEDLDTAVKVQGEMEKEYGPLAIFKINVAFVGQVLI